MKTTEKLQRIRDRCVELLAIAEKNLKPCPFCGSGKIEVIYDDGYSVGCKDCSTYVAPFLGNEADNKQKHIDFWNTRACACAGSAEAGWRATIAAIDFIVRRIKWGWDGDRGLSAYADSMESSIIAAWPEELL